MDDNQFTPQEPQQAAPQPQTYEQPAYQAPAPQPAPQQTYQQPQQGYQQPAYQQPVAPASDKNKLVAGLLGIFLGSLGIHKFYLGYTKAAVIMLLVSLLTFGFGAAIMGIIGLIEGIIYLTKNDQDFYNIYVANQKQWF